MKYIVSKIKISELLGLILLLFISLPIIIMTQYAGLGSDDFVFINSSTGTQRFEVAFKEMIMFYKGWQGTFFGAFIQNLGIQYQYGSAGIRFVLFILSTLFFISITLFLIGLYKYCFGIQRYSLLLVSVVLISALERIALSEPFMWFSGAIVYTLPITCGFFSIYILIINLNKKKPFLLLLGCVLAFLSSGGTLMIASIICSLMFLVLIIDFFGSKKIKLGYIVFLSSLLGAVINVIAPGNFIRHSVIDDTGIHYIKIFFETVIKVNADIVACFSNGLLWGVAILCFVFGYYFSNISKIQYNKVLLVIVYCYLCQLMVVYPLALGYSGFVDFPDRAQFAERVAISLYTSFICLYLGGWVKYIAKIELTRGVLIPILIVLAMIGIPYFDYNKMVSITPFKIAIHILKGDYKAVSEHNQDILEAIKLSEDTDVVIYDDFDESQFWTNIYPPLISDNAEYYVNKSCAIFYDKDSVTVVNTVGQ